MPRHCHNVSLKRGHVFSQRRTCHEIHAGLVNCMWKHCFVQIVTLICPESQNEAASWYDKYENLSKW
jgi:hypothetical protein